MLIFQNITTGYGKKQVLTDVSFEVKQGEIILLSGGNGSGKSTILKTIYGLLKPWNTNAGIIFEGKNIIGLAPFEMIKEGIVYIPQKNNVFEDFTIEENLLTSASIYTKKETKLRIENVYKSLPLLSKLKKRTPFNMSGGEKQLLAFGNALVHNPRLILFDEPFSGVDIENSSYISESIRLLNKNTTFVIIEHKKYLFENWEYREMELELGMIKY